LLIHNRALWADLPKKAKKRKKSAHGVMSVHVIPHCLSL
jgi:hypothetical protein